MAIGGYIIVLIFGTSDDESNLINGSVVFFAIATILLVLGVIAIPIMFKDPYFLLNVSKSREISEEVIKEICIEYELNSNEYLLNRDTGYGKQETGSAGLNSVSRFLFPVSLPPVITLLPLHSSPAWPAGRYSADQTTR